MVWISATTEKWQEILPSGKPDKKKALKIFLQGFLLGFKHLLIFLCVHQLIQFSSIDDRNLD